MNPANYYPPCTRGQLVCAPMLGWEHAGWLLSYALNAKRILEYGSGGSTLWLGQMCPDAIILSIEHDRDWATRVARMGELLGFRDGVVWVIYALPDEYVEQRDLVDSAPYDLIFIDGKHDMRTPCLKASYDLLAPGGVVFLDNSEEPLYQEGKTWLLAQPGMSLMDERTDPTWNPERSNRHLWAVQKSE